jgi:nitrate reductase (cytochrome), electron transfer subunit
MKWHRLLGVTGLSLAAYGTAYAQQAIDDASLGLNKQSVFETPSPQPFTYPQTFPGKNRPLPAAYPGAPPQIPHDITAFEPVTLARNMCVRCHDKPDRSKKVPGEATPIPPSHYRNMREAPDTVKQRLDGSRYICTQCHAPQANVKPLVANSFAGRPEP